ncbi:hypothetical protein HK100_012396, partial [Physocladia obscura]
MLVRACVLTLGWILQAFAATVTWPSANSRYDELEEVYYQDAGYRGAQFSTLFTPCSDDNALALRMGFHDMVGHNVSDSANLVGGIDSSLRYELNHTNNVFSFNAHYFYYTNFANQRASVADLQALGLVHGVALCNGPTIPYRAGRLDALSANPSYAFLPSDVADPIHELIGNFSLMGFNQSEFISVIACAHTIGGVEHDEHPLIVSAAENKLMFDSTNLIFDDLIVSQYVSGQSVDPLVVGPTSFDVDFRIFSSDGNVTIKQMNSPEAFASRCTDMLAKVLNSVPTTSVLTDVLVPYEVKPSHVGYDFVDGVLTFLGEIRVRTTEEAVDSVSIISSDSGETISATAISNGNATGGFPVETFQFYSFAKAINKTAVSAYSVNVTYSNGTSILFDNNEALFPIEPRVFYSQSSSCLATNDVMNWTATIVAAVSNDLVTNPVHLIFTQGVRDSVPTFPVVNLQAETITMSKVASQNLSSSFTLYSATVTINAWTQNQATFDISVGGVNDSFHKLTDLVGQNCAATNNVLYWNITYVQTDLGSYVPGGARRVIGVNGVWPVDAVYANLGDTLQIRVANQLDVPTSLHFFGIHQTGSPQYDGVPYVTQCPIPSGNSFTYTVFLNQSGTFWIEGDYMGQSVDGLRVPLIVRSTGDVKYNNDFIVRLTDWYSDEYPDLFAQFSSNLNPLGTLPTPGAILANEQSNSSLPFITGETYMVRLISMASQIAMNIAIDGHNMTIVEVDGVSIQPYEVTSLAIAPSQRLGVLVTAVDDTNTTLVNYAMRISQRMKGADSDGTEVVSGQLTTYLVISYAVDNPLGQSVDTSEGGGIVIIYNDTVLPSLEPLIDTDVLIPTQQILLDASVLMMADGSSHGTFNDIAYIRPAVPSLMTALSMPSDALKANLEVYGIDTNPFLLDDGVTELVISNNNAVEYAFHLHGHSFQVIAVAALPYASSEIVEPQTGPPSRDTIHIPANYYAVVRFENENPGVWLFHGTTTFLRDSGFSATLIETPTAINITFDADFAQTCAASGIPFTGNAAGNALLNMTGLQDEVL